MFWKIPAATVDFSAAESTPRILIIFCQIAQYMAREAEEFVDRRGVTSGVRVLDVACGTGNLAVPAARKGAQVTGVDIAPNLLEQARRRAASENLQATFEEGDAEQLSYPDEHFDVVVSMFGAMFAPRPELVAPNLSEFVAVGERSPWPTGRRREPRGRCSG
jgi:2-polyprenyl-3-methyl-5-hydroxy-6-metoxy-1,4-benzoquinol methylase